MEKNIEVEVRAEISPQEFKAINDRLSQLGQLISSTKRLSVMYFGEVNGQKTDIRIRITNGQCEIAAKFGSFSSHERVELSQRLTHDQFMGMVKIFSHFKFDTEIGERLTHNYQLGNNVVASLVLAGSISYIEIEKMSASSDVESSRILLQEIAEELNLKLLDESGFDSLCQNLRNNSDWSFGGSDADYLKLQEIFNKYSI